jgi:hypothetical protein
MAKRYDSEALAADALQRCAERKRRRGYVARAFNVSYGNITSFYVTLSFARCQSRCLRQSPMNPRATSQAFNPLANFIIWQKHEWVGFDPPIAAPTCRWNASS